MSLTTRRPGEDRPAVPERDRQAPPPGEPASGPSVLREAFDVVNGFLTAKKTGLGLILAMAFLSLMGTLLVQSPAGVRGDPQAYAAWLDSVRPKYGGWTTPLAVTGMFEVFSSAWFRGVSVLLALSIIACTAGRVPMLWQRARHPHTHPGAGLFEHARLHEDVASPLPTGAALEAVRATLRRRRFRVLADERARDSGCYADRFAWAPFGTAIAHTSFVIILLGVLISTTLGIKEPLPVSVGSTVAVGHGSGLDVRADAFADTYHPDGRPQDYASDLVVLSGGDEVARQKVRVNEPLRYDGFTFYQSSFGTSVDVRVADASGQVLRSGGVPLQWRSSDDQNSVGTFALPGTDLTAYVATPASGRVTSAVGAGQLRIELYREGQDNPFAAQVLTQGTPGQVGDLTVTFERERQYTGLTVSRDPGAPWVWVGCALLSLGVCLTMFFRHRRVWIQVGPGSDGVGSRVRLASPDGRTARLESWFTALAADVSAALSPPTAAASPATFAAGTAEAGTPEPVDAAPPATRTSSRDPKGR